MSLPTSGYTAATIVYSVAIEGSPGFTFDVSVSTGQLGQSVAEEIATILDSSLVQVANDLESYTGATLGRVYKFINGTINDGDIA